jgi:hypothetical protein
VNLFCQLKYVSSQPQRRKLEQIINHGSLEKLLKNLEGTHFVTSTLAKMSFSTQDTDVENELHNTLQAFDKSIQENEIVLVISLGVPTIECPGMLQEEKVCMILPCKFWYIRNFAMPEILVYIRNFGISEILVYQKFWYIRNFGIYQKFWYIRNFGISAILVYQKFWYIRNFGISEILVYKKFWYIRNFGISVLPKKSYQHTDIGFNTGLFGISVCRTSLGWMYLV